MQQDRKRGSRRLTHGYRRPVVQIIQIIIIVSLIFIIISITILESTIGGNIIFILIVIHSLDVRAKKFFLPNVFPSYVNYLGLFRFVS